MPPMPRSRNKETAIGMARSSDPHFQSAAMLSSTTTETRGWRPRITGTSQWSVIGRCRTKWHFPRDVQWRLELYLDGNAGFFLRGESLSKVQTPQAEACATKALMVGNFHGRRDHAHPK